MTTHTPVACTSSYIIVAFGVTQTNIYDHKARMRKTTKNNCTLLEFTCNQQMHNYACVWSAHVKVDSFVGTCRQHILYCDSIIIHHRQGKV